MKVVVVVALVVAEVCSGQQDPFTLPDFAGSPLPLPVAVDPNVEVHLNILSAVSGALVNYETPIALRLGSLVDTLVWNCAASYHDAWLDALTLERPVTAVPDRALHTSDSRVLCSAYAVKALYPELFIEDDVPRFLETFLAQLLGFTDVGFPSDFPLLCDEDSSTTTTTNCGASLKMYLEEKGYVPEAVGAAVAYGVMEYAKDDGWNADGRLGEDGSSECTANCFPYRDTTRYDPSKGTCSVERRRRQPAGWCWEPLEETNGAGFFVKQEHVVPHVGPRATPRVVPREVVDNDLRLSSPLYDFDEEADLVLERTRDLDDAKKAAIEFFDSKVGITTAVITALAIKYGSALTHERLAWYLLGYTVTEHDAVIVAWKEKVRHSSVRPPTVVRDGPRRNEEVKTFGGPFEGVKVIKRKDWQPYKRVMPHAEYPSGSGCICLGVEQHSNAALDFLYGPDSPTEDADTAALPVGVIVEQGSSTVEPGLTPQQGVLLFYHTLHDMRLACGQSRLDGGMHFTKAVTDAYTLCDGIGDAVADYFKLLVHNDSYAFPPPSP
eukprot:CAMPEP_0118913556 /NCGR_PEP_ID=MMETSP1166-20130328/14315_1 /TAXON_ID=1104430 /ORGANISM="Chrysoreinhardia sp, Strain CCMP3193" /LENGTH=551 /DNA_ID=CAMNT_0006853119 /DNA_START=148 /DNA_END=1806 /DNA_ORIENTATION=-